MGILAGCGNCFSPGQVGGVSWGCGCGTLGVWSVRAVGVVSWGVGVVHWGCGQWDCRCGTLGVWSVGAVGVVHWGCGQWGCGCGQLGLWVGSTAQTSCVWRVSFTSSASHNEPI